MIEPILDRFILCSAVRRALEPLLCWQQLLVLSGLKTCFEAEISSMTENFFAPSCQGELWSEKADGLGIRHRIVEAQNQNKQKGNAILDPKLKLKTGCSGSPES